MLMNLKKCCWHFFPKDHTKKKWYNKIKINMKTVEETYLFKFVIRNAQGKCSFFPICFWRYNTLFPLFRWNASLLGCSLLCICTTLTQTRSWLCHHAFTENKVDLEWCCKLLHYLVLSVSSVSEMGETEFGDKFSRARNLKRI